MGDQSKKDQRVRLAVLVSDATIAAIDDYLFATRAPNRAEAIRRVLKIGQPAQPPEERSH